VVITIIGGTGHLGFGLALRLAEAGYKIIIGSRKEKKAKVFAEKIKTQIGSNLITGMINKDAALNADICIISIPNKARKVILSDIKPFLVGKVVLDVTVPLLPGKNFRYNPPEAGSNAEETAEIIGEGARVVAGFHNVSAFLLSDFTKEIESDVLIAGNEDEAKVIIIEMVKKIGLRVFDTGPLENARTIEALTPLIINLNKKYKKKHIGIKLTGI